MIKEKPKEETRERKWKGKDWYSILAPKMFNENFILETPATDPKNLMGRSVSVMAPHLFGEKIKQHMKFIFKIDDVKDKTATTRFHRLESLPEFVARNVRQTIGKIESFDDVKTKDNWSLQVSSTVILNKNTESNIKTKARKYLSDYVKKAASNATLEDFLKEIIASSYQKEIRKDASKFYPIRFIEFHKVEVLKMPA
jgi:small subunit ribosomal protein S3Ae